MALIALPMIRRKSTVDPAFAFSFHLGAQRRPNFFAFLSLYAPAAGEGQAKQKGEQQAKTARNRC
jgi:hypothetical protein